MLQAGEFGFREIDFFSPSRNVLILYCSQDFEDQNLTNMATTNLNHDAAFEVFVNGRDKAKCILCNRLTNALIFNILLAAVL